MNDFDNRLTNHEKNQLIDFLQHYMGMEMRRKLMRELPQAYNALCGWTVVDVVIAKGDDKGKRVEE